MESDTLGVGDGENSLRLIRKRFIWNQGCIATCEGKGLCCFDSEISRKAYRFDECDENICPSHTKFKKI